MPVAVVHTVNDLIYKYMMYTLNLEFVITAFVREREGARGSIGKAPREQDEGARGSMQGGA